jgi:hypothetical protein
MDATSPTAAPRRAWNYWFEGLPTLSGGAVSSLDCRSSLIVRPSSDSYLRRSMASSFCAIGRLLTGLKPGLRIRVPDT